MEDIKEGRKKEQEYQKLKKRKKKLDVIISQKRGLLSSNQDLPQKIELEEEKEEELCKPVMGYHLPLNQYQKYMKRDCTKLRYFYCGSKGHIKQKYWK